MPAGGRSRRVLARMLRARRRARAGAASMAGRKPDPNKVLRIDASYKPAGYEGRVNHSAVRAERAPKQRACLPRTMRIGEFSAHTEKGTFAVAVSDGDNHCLVEVLERPRGDALGDFFGGFSAKERARVEYYCCDMSATFIAAKEPWLPGAKLCIDRFHVAKEVTRAFDKVRVRVADSEEVDGEGNATKKYEFAAREKERIETARYRFRTRRPELERIDAEYATALAERRDRLREQLVGMGPRGLDDLMPRPKAPKCGRVDALLEWDRDLEAAYRLLQAFYLWSDMKWCAEKRDGLETWCQAAMESGLPEFKVVAGTFRRHREGILNGYKFDKTNALAEGLNNTIKLLEKCSYGNPTFARMRRRCLFTLGYYKLSQNYVHLPQIDAGGEAAQAPSRPWRRRRRGRRARPQVT